MCVCVCVCMYALVCGRMHLCVGSQSIQGPDNFCTLILDLNPCIAANEINTDYPIYMVGFMLCYKTIISGL